MTLVPPRSRPPRRPSAGVPPFPVCLLLLFTLLLVLPPRCLLPVVEGCTTIAVGKLATTDGSVLSSHSNDGEGSTDPRLVVIPASTWPANSSRKVFYSPESFPRYVGYDRSNGRENVVEAYEPGRGDNGDVPFEPTCEIPQVERTYRYFEETYGALNERQLGIAESTCSGVFGAAPRGIPYPGYGLGKACLSIDALTQIAMERHRRARDAIVEMGELAVRYGFYGAGLFEGTAESLIVTDTEEAWVFHVLPDPSGSSAIWAARRVPDDGFAVVPNVFIIRGIDADDEANFLYSESAFSVAAELGWWSPSSGERLDFAAAYSDGEYAHKYYSGRRSWGIYRLFAPSLELSAEYEEWRISDPYPFSAKPDKKLGVADVAAAMRSFYEGTPYSQAGDTDADANADANETDGKARSWAGGPWGTPDHVAGSNSTHGVIGNWERTVGLYRTSDSYVVQSRSHLPDAVGGVLWYGPYAAPYTVFTPFAAGMTRLPRATLGHHLRLDKGTLFWANRFVGNYVQLKWDEMMREVAAFQRRRMEESLGVQAKADAMAIAAAAEAAATSPGGAKVVDPIAAAAAIDIDAIQELYDSNARRTLSETWDLADHLLFKYADGQVHSTPSSALGTSTPPRSYDARGATVREAEVVDQPGYPAEWLERVGYKDGPPPPPDCAELGWRCGHKPHGGEEGEGGLRGGDGSEGRSDVEEKEGDEERVAGSAEKEEEGTTTTVGAEWREYARARARAIEKGHATCGTRGDVAAALGGGRDNGCAVKEEGRGLPEGEVTTATAASVK